MRISTADAGRRKAHNMLLSRRDADPEEDPSFHAGSSDEGSTSSSGEDRELRSEAKMLAGGGHVAVEKVGSRCLYSQPRCPRVHMLWLMSSKHASREAAGRAVQAALV